MTADLQSQVWQLVSPRTLFRGLDPESKEHHDGYLVAEMGAVMGMRRSEIFPLFLDENGK